MPVADIDPGHGGVAAFNLRIEQPEWEKFDDVEMFRE